jgi:NADPH:quinone reductase
VRPLGARHVATGGDFEGAAASGPFDLILESVGGTALGNALGLLAPGGSCVPYGALESAVTTFDAARFRIGGTSLYGLVMPYELRRSPLSVGLAELPALMKQGRIVSVIELRTAWDDVARVARDLMDRRFIGKAVLTVDPALS